MSDMVFEIEYIAIHDNHNDSWIAKYLDKHGFTLRNPYDTFHRVGPWIWVYLKDMTYGYCPHYGVSCGHSQLDTSLTGKDFCTIWEILSRRQRLHVKTGIKWSERISQQ